LSPVNAEQDSEYLKRRLVKTLHSKHRAATFTIAEINFGKTSRRDLLLKLDLPLLELRESFCYSRPVERLRILRFVETCFFPLSIPKRAEMRYATREVQ
jgi:hypothetical protein